MSSSDKEKLLLKLIRVRNKAGESQWFRSGSVKECSSPEETNAAEESEADEELEREDSVERTCDDDVVQLQGGLDWKDWKEARQKYELEREDSVERMCDRIMNKELIKGFEEPIKSSDHEEPIEISDHEEPIEISDDEEPIENSDVVRISSYPGCYNEV